MENVFDVLCSALAEPEIKQQFLDSEGVDLMILMDDFYDSKGLFNDIVTLRWMRVPCKPIPTQNMSLSHSFMYSFLFQTLNYSRNIIWYS